MERYEQESDDFVLIMAEKNSELKKEIEKLTVELNDAKTIANYKEPYQAQVIQVIKTVSIIGDGSTTPARKHIRYWSLDGELLCEIDGSWETPGNQTVSSQ